MDTMTDTEKPVPNINLDLQDLTHVRIMLAEMVKQLNAGPKSRPRSLLITKLEEASMWASEGLRTE